VCDDWVLCVGVLRHGGLKPAAGVRIMRCCDAPMRTAAQAVARHHKRMVATCVCVEKLPHATLTTRLTTPLPNNG
jgi:hypothetical protein